MTPLAARTFDPLDPEFLADPHEVLAQLRQESPVFFDEQLDMWIISRHEDIRAVLHDHSTFLPDNALDAFAPPSFSTLRKLAQAGFRLPPTLANNSGANHPELRRLTTRFIGPSQLSRATPLITHAANAAIETALSVLESESTVDLVDTVARQVPARVILPLLGFHDLDVSTFVRWSSAALELFWGRPSEERQEQLAADLVEFHQWIESASHDNDGMMSALRDLNLTRQEVIGACFFTLIAGQETTAQLLASSFQHLLIDSTRWLSLREDPASGAGWVEEILRREPPISTWRRVTSRASSIGDVDIPEGAQVLLMITSAGSDADVFANAEELCPHRVNQREHLAFGFGRHRCPGAELSRSEAEITLRIATERFPALRLTETQPPMVALLSYRSPARVLVERA